MSYRNDTNATYDRTLLSSIPDPTRAEKQEGYNVDLLDDGRDHSVPDGLPSEHQALAPADGYSPGAAGLARKQGQLENGHEQPSKAPWYRTRWGITAIVIAIVVIIGAAVGGAVGSSHHSSSHSSLNSNSSGTPSGGGNLPTTGLTGNSVTSASGAETGNTTLPTATATATATADVTGASSPPAQSAGAPLQQTQQPTTQTQTQGRVGPGS